MVGAASQYGFRSVVFNSRGTSDQAVTSPQFYSASFTGDMRYTDAASRKRTRVKQLMHDAMARHLVLGRMCFHGA